MEFVAVIVGIAISLMLVATAALQPLLGPATTLLVIHLVGLVLVVPLAVLVRAPALRPSRVPWPFYLGGLVGLVLVLINNRTVPVLGAGLAVALGIVGQLVASSLVDHFGWFGFQRRPFHPAKAVGLGVAAVGAFAMTLGEA